MRSSTRRLACLTLGLILFGVVEAGAQVTNTVFLPYPAQNAVRELSDFWGFDNNFPYADAPSCVVPSLDGRGKFVVVPDTNTIYRDVSGSPVVLATGEPYKCLVISPDQQKLYVTTGNNELLVMDPVTGAVSAAITVGDRPYDVAISPDGSRVYVLSTNSNSIEVIDTSTERRHHRDPVRQS